MADAVISSTAKVRVYALTVHSRSPMEAPRSRRIVFSAVATTSMSSTTMNDATDASASAQPCDRLRFCPCGRLRLLVVTTSAPMIDVSCGS